MSLKRGVLWDSSAILAVLHADDADHERAIAIAGRIASERRPTFLTNYIEVEAHALLLGSAQPANPRRHTEQELAIGQRGSRCVVRAFLRKLGRALAREWLLTGGLRMIATRFHV